MAPEQYEIYKQAEQQERGSFRDDGVLKTKGQYSQVLQAINFTWEDKDEGSLYGNELYDEYVVGRGGVYRWRKNDIINYLKGYKSVEERLGALSKWSLRI